MVVGVVSNTDGRADAMELAIGLLREAGAELLLHLGDVGGRHVLDVLAGFDSEFVWGDRDRDKMGLLRHAQRLEIPCYGALGEFDLDGKRVVMLHGEDDKVVRRLVDEQQYDYLLIGHALTSEDRRVGRTRIVNPGALHGGPKRTLALLNTATDEMKLLTL